MTMNKSYIKYILLLLTLLTALPASARKEQYFRLRGEQLYMEGRFRDALKMFEKYEDGDSSNIVLDEPYLHLRSEVEYKLGDFDAALHTYHKALETDSENLNYPYLKGLILRSSRPSDYDHLLTLVDSVEQAFYTQFTFQDTVSRFTVKPFYPLNTPYSEFGALAHKDRIYFSSITDRLLVKKDVNTNLSHYDIYSVDKERTHKLFDFQGRYYADLNDQEKDAADSIRQRVNFRYEKALNTPYNDGPIAFYQDELAYVTRNEVHKKREEQTFNLSLYEVPLKDDSTDYFEKSAMAYFGDYFSPSDVGQITFSPDFQMACMAVKLKDSLAQSDLWFSQLDAEQMWGEPYKADERINTAYDELFPWFSNDGFLYFSSDGHPGFGGLDVFRIDLSSAQARVHNIGLGVNTPYDDFAFNINPLGQGYLSSNRPGGRGSDDIYTVAMNYGYIEVVLQGDTAWVDNPNYVFYDFRRDSLEAFNIKQDTHFITEKLPYGDYDLMHSFPVDSLYGRVALYEDTVTLYVKYEKIPPDTLPVSFTNFCFDCDGMSEINADKFKRMVDFLLDFPEIEVRLTGNTDMFGTHRYNDALGMRRADVMERWLREAGVRNPIVKASNGKRKLISETNHRLNRRVDVELFWPDDTTRITYISDDDPRLDRELVIEYDAAKKFDTPLEPGYYIMVHQSNRYMTEEVCKAKYGVDDLGILLHSEQWNVFNYYLNVPFRSAQEAQAYIKTMGIKGKVMYLN